MGCGRLCGDMVGHSGGVLEVGVPHGPSLLPPCVPYPLPVLNVPVPTIHP